MFLSPPLLSLELVKRVPLGKDSKGGHLSPALRSMQLSRVPCQLGRCTGCPWLWVVLGPGIQLQGEQEAGSG